ncbi:hypothetical protein ES703_88020 [subsurface metagenome]
MRPDFDLIPMISIHPDRINFYSEVNWHPYKPRRDPSVHLIDISRDHKGKVSPAARRKISRAIDYHLFLANEKVLPNTAHGKAYSFKLCFITLTLPSTQVHSDQVIKARCLHQFLTEACKKWHVKNYLWRAEKQKNGNIHFHILADKFIPWSELRDVWNRIVNKLGYVDRYRDQMRAFHEGCFSVREDLLKAWSYKAQIKAYKAGKANDWSSPNSTDIHSVWKMKNIKAYVSKYCTKDEQSEGLTGRLWGCNEELSNIPGARIVIDQLVSDALKSIFDKYSPEIYEGSYFSCASISFEWLRDPDSTELFKAFAGFLNDHFGHSLQAEIDT